MYWESSLYSWESTLTKKGKRDASAGALVMVPPGAPHTFANHGDDPLVMVNTFTPDLYVQYFRDLREAIAAGASMHQAAAQVMPHYATTLATGFA